MPRQFQPTGSRNFFIGREQELKSVLQLLQNGEGKWLAQILGEAGIGKTRFLEHLRERVQHSKLGREWYCADIVDFYKVSNQTTFGLLAEIARRVGNQQFTQFESQRQIYEETIKNQPDAGLQQEAFHRVANAFFADWRELLRKGRRLVLLFDTCEEMHLLANWLNRTLLPRLWQIQQDLQLQNGDAAAPAGLQPQIVAIFAGQTALAVPREMEPVLLNLQLPPLRQEEVLAFFKQAKWFSKKIHDKKQLVELNTRCGGRPLFVALSYDWLANEMGAIDDLLDTSRPFTERLVEWILLLRDNQSSAILAAALAWRRMEAGLLAKLMQITEPEAVQLFEALKDHSFVKYRPPDAEQNFPGSLQLHDAIREIILRHLWPREGRWTQRAMLQDVIAWYEEERIGNSKLLGGEELPPTDELRALLAEYLYYRLLQNVLEGSHLGEKLFKTASYYLDISFGELLNHEISRFEKELPNDRVDQLRFQQALMAFRRDDYTLASDLWYPLTRLPDGDKKLQATTHMLLVELESYTARYHEAEEHAQAAENDYNQLLSIAEPESTQYFLLSRELGQLYNNWGYIFRAKSRWDKALQLYQKALACYQKVPETGIRKNVARTLNNIGFIHFQQNDFEQALTYVGRALQIRRELRIPYELGLGHNTLGMIMERQGRFDDAADLYQKARHYFEVSHSDRGLALVHINIGRMRRITNDFEQSLTALDYARRVLEEKNDVTYLIMALNEIGCAYRQRGSPVDRPQAESFLKQSLALSQKIGDRKAEADNFEDLGLLYYYWGKAHKEAKATVKANRYFDQVREVTQKAFEIAEHEDLPFLRAKVERIKGDVDFEKQDYDKAFYHLFHACELLAQALQKSPASPIQEQYRHRLRENADRLQERLNALPDLTVTRRFTENLLDRFDHMSGDLKDILGVVEAKLRATLQLSKMLMPTV